MDFSESDEQYLKALSNLSSRFLFVRLRGVDILKKCYTNAVHEDIKVGFLKRICREILFQFCSPMFSEKDWSKSLMDFIRYATVLSLPFDFEALSAEFIVQRFDSIMTSPSSIVWSIELATILLVGNKTKSENNFDILTVPWIEQLVSVQCKLYEALLMGFSNYSRFCSRALRNMRDTILCIPEVISIMLQVKGTNHLPCFHVLSLCYDLKRILPNYLPDQCNVRVALLEGFQKVILASKQPPPPCTLKPFSSLLSSLSDAEWQSDAFEGVLLRLAKKSPETCISIVADAAEHVSTDWSRYFLDGGGALAVRCLKSSNDTARVSAVQFVKFGGRKCQNANAVVSLCRALMDSLMGKVVGSALTLSYQKQCVLDALGEVVHVTIMGRFQSEEISQLSEEVISALFAFMEKESDDSMRVSCSIVLGEWLRNTNVLDTSVVNIIEQILKRRTPTNLGPSNACLLALTCIFKSPILPSRDQHATVLQTLVPALSIVIKDAAKKTQAANTDAILALRLLLELNLTCPVEEISKLEEYVTHASSSFLYSKPLWSQLSAAFDVTHASQFFMCHIWESIAAIIGHYFRNNPDSVPPPREVYSHLLYAQLVPNLDVRASIAHFVKGVFQSNCSQVATFLETALQLMEAHSVDFDTSHMNYLRDFKSRSYAENGIELSEGPAHDRTCLAKFPPSRLSPVILNCFQECNVSLNAWNERIFGATLLLLSHPFVSGSSTKLASSLLRKVLKQENVFSSVKQEVDIPLKSLRSMYSGVLASWVVHHCSHAESRSMREAGTAALSVLYDTAHIGGRFVLETQIVPTLTACLESEVVTGLSNQDIDVWSDPSVLLPVEEVIDLADIKITNADRKKASARGARRGQFGSDFVEDAEWVEQVKKEKAKKALEAKGVVSADKDQLQKQAMLIQSKVQTIVDKLENVCSCFSYISHNCVEVVKANTHIVLAVLMKAMRGRLVPKEAFRSLVAVCDAVVDPSLQGIKRQIAYSLRVCALTIDRPFAKGENADARYRETLESASPLISVVKGLYESTVRASGASLSSSTFLLVFPVLQSIFSLSALIAGCEHGFAVLNSCWDLVSEEIYRSGGSNRFILQSMIHLCLKTMASFRVEPSASSVLLKVVGSGPMSPEEWNPLFGPLGLLHSMENVRTTALQCVSVALSTDTLNGAMNQNKVFISSLWVVCHDENASIAAIARSTWEQFACVVSPSYVAEYMPHLKGQSLLVAKAAARAFVGGLKAYPESHHSALSALKELYSSSLPAVSAPVEALSLDGKGSAAVSSKDLSSFMSGNLKSNKASASEDATWQCRLAISEAFAACGTQNVFALDAEGNSELVDLMSFILRVGVVDSNSDVRAAMVTCGQSLVDAYCGDKAVCEHMLATLQAALREKQTKLESVENFDNRHEAAVVLVGSVGKHLNKDDPIVFEILTSLVDALSTPVERVQRAVSDCLVPLVQLLKTSDRVQEYLQLLLNKVVTAETYGERRGAAFGIGSFVKGIGIPCIKQFDIINRLKDTCTTGSVNSRQGALFAFELLSDRLGMLFEPYVITIIPLLLKCFSHTSDHVREAANLAAKSIMGRLSAHGVKQVLSPILLSLPDEREWKSRQEALRLLGTMAFCAPKQLSACLPQIIPCLVQAGSDPHPKVKESAKNALSDISSVIRNPEIQNLSPILLGALTDPAHKTKEALEALLECEFMHSIDAPSLALLIPILGRALRDRGGDLKRKSTAILGNISSMILDQKILVPYLSQIVPGLQTVLLDPIPDVRATCAKAFGGLIAGVGEENLSDIIPWLMRTMQSDTSPVERSGASQGLAEICVALGNERMRSILAEVLKLFKSPRSAAREGLLWLMCFLPVLAGETFIPYVESTLPVVLLGLSDDDDGVRDVAMRAGQVVVNTHGRNSTQCIIPPLLDGMCSDDWRIRQSSVTLMGDLLYMIGDTKAIGITEIDEEDVDDESAEGYGTPGFSRAILSIRAKIGEDKCDLVLSAVYIARFDTNSTVRQMSLQIWKSIVNNPPATLKAIMDVLVDQIVQKLSSEGSDQRPIAGRALGDLVHKLGDSVLPVIIPVLDDGLDTDDTSFRQGVCLGLSEILSASTPKQIELYMATLMPALHHALCDEDHEVRTSAAQAFLALMRAVGPLRAMEDIVPPLLDSVCEEDEDLADADNSFALLGLKEIVQCKPRDLLEYLLPKLMTSPMSAAYAKILQSIAQSVGSHMNYHYSTMIPQMINELNKAEEEVREAAEDDEEKAICVNHLTIIKNSFGEVAGGVVTSGVNFFISELGKQIEHESPSKRRWGCWLAASFFTKTKSEFGDYIPVLLKYILGRSADAEAPVLECALEAFVSLLAAITVENLVNHMEFIRSCINLTVSEVKHRTGFKMQMGEDGSFLLPLFMLPKALEPFLAVYIHALMNGSADMREVAADGIGELVQMVEPTVLRPYLIKTTGPLIRVVGDRFPSNVKNAILQTLCLLLDKGGAGLKAFVPQLQTTFVKSLTDPSKQVRSKAAGALGRLMGMSTRVDPLINELCAGCLQAESAAIKASFVEGLGAVMSQLGADKVNAAALQKVTDLIISCNVDEDETIRMFASKCVGSCVAIMTPAQVSDFVLNITSYSGVEAWTTTAGRLLSCGSALRAMGERGVEVKGDAMGVLHLGLNDDRVGVRNAACSALEMAFTTPVLVTGNGTLSDEDKQRNREHVSTTEKLLSEFAGKLSLIASSDASSETRRHAVSAIKQVAKCRPALTVPYVVNFVRALQPYLSPTEPNIRLRMAAERATKYLVGVVRDGPEAKHAVAAMTAITNADVNMSKFVKDYVKRTLIRLVDDSDDEGDKW